MTKKTNEIYTAITNQAKLTPAHKKKLKIKRGFSDLIIDELKFFSTGKYLTQIVINLRDKEGFTEDQLIKSGIGAYEIDRKGNKLFGACRKLEADGENSNIVIPFLDIDGKTVYHLYPHKNGFKDIGIQSYCRFLETQGKSDTILITESPFKTVVLYQLFGKEYVYNGLSGIASHIGEHFLSYSTYLKELNIKSAIIIFDNEIKSNPNFPNYKPDIWKRYDTEKYAYLMAYKLNKAGINTRIAILSDDWMIDGKIDCDGALAQGRTKKDFESIIKNSFSFAAYIRSFKKNSEQEFIVHQTIRKYFSTINYNIEEDASGYFIKKEILKNKKKVIIKEKLTNFRIILSKIVKNIDNSTGEKKEEYVRYIQFINNFNKKSKELMIDAETMNDINKFRIWATKQGNYFCEKLIREQLVLIFKKLTAESQSPFIQNVQNIGKLHDNCWLLGDCLFFKGQPIQLNSKKLYQIGHRAYQPLIELNKQKLPMLLNKSDLSVADILNNFYLAQNFEIITLVGYISAVLFSDIIFPIFNLFPLGGIFGKTGSGKSTVARWLLSLLGIYRRPIDISGTTAEGFVRELAVNYNLVVPIDEFRESKKDLKLVQTFLNIYERNTGIKAQFTNDLKTKTNKINSALFIAGQTTPSDLAFLSRIVYITMSIKNLKKEKNQEYYKFLEKEQLNFSNFMLEILKKEKEIITGLKKSILFYQNLLFKKIRDMRLSQNYGIVLGTFVHVIKILKIEKDLLFSIPDFVSFILNQHIKKQKEENKCRDEILDFFQDVNQILARMEEDKYEQDKGGMERFVICHSLLDLEISLNQRFNLGQNLGQNNKYIIAIAIYDIWKLYIKDLRSMGKEPSFNYLTLRGYLKNESFFIGFPQNTNKTKKFNGKSKPCIFLKYESVKNTLLPSCNFFTDGNDIFFNENIENIKKSYKNIIQ